MAGPEAWREKQNARTAFFFFFPGCPVIRDAFLKAAVQTLHPSLCCLESAKELFWNSCNPGRRLSAGYVFRFSPPENLCAAFSKGWQPCRPDASGTRVTASIGEQAAGTSLIRLARLSQDGGNFKTAPICRSIPVFGMTAPSSIPACSLIPILWHGTAIAVRGTRLKTKTAFPLCCPARAVEGGRACRYKCPQKDESGAKIRKFLYGRCFFRPEIRG